MFGDALDEEDINLLEERVSTSRIEDIMFGSSKEEEESTSSKDSKDSKDSSKDSDEKEERFEEKKGFTFPVHPQAVQNVLPQIATSALPQALHYGGGSVAQIGSSQISPMLSSAASVLTGVPYVQQQVPPGTVLTTTHPVANPMGSAMLTNVPAAMYANALPTTQIPVGFQQHPALGFGNAASKGGLPTYSRTTGFSPGVGFTSTNALPTYTRPTTSPDASSSSTTSTTSSNIQPFVYNTLGGAPTLLRTPMPPMPPDSTSYGEMAAPPPPSIITNTPDVLPSPMPPILPHQMRRFATSNDVGRGFAPAGTEEVGHRGAVDVHLSEYPGRSGVQADPSAPLSRMETEVHSGEAVPH